MPLVSDVSCGKKKAVSITFLWAVNWLGSAPLPGGADEAGVFPDISNLSAAKNPSASLAFESMAGCALIADGAPSRAPARTVTVSANPYPREAIPRDSLF